jgi:hypothetical protein
MTDHWGPRRRQAVAAYFVSVLLLVLVVGAAPTRLATLPTSEIRAGMRGYGLTVFRGTKPERFDIEVIDVLHNFRPDQDLILIRTPHPVLNHAGSVAGMSGSPIYIDEKMIGAYAYGWNYGKDPVAGVTPIANMLAELSRPLHPGSFPFIPLAGLHGHEAKREVRDPYLGQERRDAFFALSQRARPARSSVRALVPAATPLLVSGMTAQVADLLAEKLEPFGLSVLEAGGASGENARDEQPTGFVDGGSIAVQLLRGDIQATAVGTVTYVDGQRLIAFGHPMLDAGEIGLPTATSRVLHILASERSSFKIAEAIKPLGALVHDRQAAIVVDTNLKAASIPVTIRLRGVKEAAREVWHVQTVNHRLLTPTLVLSAIASAVGATVNDHTEMRFRATSKITLRGHGTHTVVDEDYAPVGVAQLRALSHLRLFDVLEAAYGNPFEEVLPEKIELEIEPFFGRHVTEVVGAQLLAAEIDPGESARLVVTLQPYAKPLEQRVIEVPLSESLAGESVDVEVSAGDGVSSERPIPRSFADILGIIKDRFPSTALVVSVQRKGRGMSVGGHVLRNLPGSALDALATLNDTSRGPAFATQSRIVIPMDHVMVGRAKLSLDIRKEKQ